MQNHPPDPPQGTHVAHADQEGIFNLPPNLNPVDTVIDVDQIPGTQNLNIGEIARAVETDAGERIELLQRRGVRAGCGHFLYHRSEIGGVCGPCSTELIPYLQQGLITQKAAEERSLFCREDKGFCYACHRQDLCARHSILYESERGAPIIPLCPPCHAQVKRGFFCYLLGFHIGAIRFLVRMCRSHPGLFPAIVIWLLILLGVHCALEST